MSLLEELQVMHHYKTDKYGLNYYPDYSFHFDKIRWDVKTVLEIGSYRGASLELWKDYFVNANIIGVDFKDRFKPPHPRIYAEVGNVTNQKFIDYLVEKYKRFDIVLDDGSHLASQMKMAFILLWPHTQLIYCIEDLGTQYNRFGGGSYLDGPSMVEYLKEMIDRNNVVEKTTDYKAICFHRMQCYIYKG